LSDRPITRKRLLAAAGGLALPLALGPLRPWTALVEVSPAGRLAGLLADRKSAAAVGKAYLAATPSEARQSMLVSRLTASLGSGAGSAGDDELRRLLAMQIDRDFEEERVATLDGWIVSVTEARLCALCALAA
jgi:hypothetical protein